MIKTDTLQAGDILSYSAGSQQTGPEGYRKQSVASAIFAETKKRWPGMMAKLGDKAPVVINAYPAFMGIIPEGITVDTYLNPRTFSRALYLAAKEETAAIIIGQPLYVAQLLYQHLDAAYPLPQRMHLWIGGYPLPQSLHRALTNLFQDRLDVFQIIEYFGSAEITAGAMMARDRDIFDRPIFHARKDVAVGLDEDMLMLALTDSSGQNTTPFVATGDKAQQVGRGYLIWNHDRFSPAILDLLECWDDADWQRCTGYVTKDDGNLWIQTREGQTPRGNSEIAFHDFAAHFEFSWLKKPDWRS